MAPGFTTLQNRCIKFITPLFSMRAMIAGKVGKEKERFIVYKDGRFIGVSKQSWLQREKEQLRDWRG